LQLRAKAGIAREQLLQDARSYVPLILGPSARLQPSFSASK
jgi:hypothetical protein